MMAFYRYEIIVSQRMTHTHRKLDPMDFKEECTIVMFKGFLCKRDIFRIVRGKSMFHTRGGALMRINELRHLHKNQLLIVISFAYRLFI